MMKFTYTLLLALLLVASNTVSADTRTDAYSMADVEAAIMADTKLEPAQMAQVKAAFVADVATMAKLEAEAAAEDVSD